MSCTDFPNTTTSNLDNAFFPGYLFVVLRVVVLLCFGVSDLILCVCVLFILIVFYLLLFIICGARSLYCVGIRLLD